MRNAKNFNQPFLLKSHALIRSEFSRKTFVIRNDLILVSLINIVQCVIFFEKSNIVIMFYIEVPHSFVAMDGFYHHLSRPLSISPPIRSRDKNIVSELLEHDDIFSPRISLVE